MPQKLFISDLHLSAQRSSTMVLFEQFLRDRPQPGDQLFILGDLFDAWIGDDDDAPLASHVRSTLRQTKERGVELLIQHGNRDFMLGKHFARECGATLLSDPYRLLIAQQPTLLMHGDLLCTDDVAYQNARRKLRNPIFQWVMLRKSLAGRRKLAEKYRSRSKATTAVTAAEIMDVNTRTVLEYLDKYQATQLIHGHTHRPAVHKHLLPNGTTAKRFVLDQWHAEHASVWVDEGHALRCEPIELVKR